MKAIIVVSVLLLRFGAGARAQSITEYAVAVPPFLITAGPDGALWFTAQGAVIGRITTAGAVSRYRIPGSVGPSYGIVAGPDGALWFTDVLPNTIERITTAGALTGYVIPGGAVGANGAGFEPGGMTVGPDGALWFVGAKIGRVTTAGVFTEYTIPTSNSSPNSITTGPDGALWFTERNGNKIGRVTTTGTITEYKIPTSQAYPTYITAGPDGALWFSETTNISDKIGRITTAGVITEYTTPTASSEPYGITAGPDGAIWFCELGANKIGRITVPSTAISPGGVVSASAFGAFSSIAPGSWIETYGSNLASNTRGWTGADFSGVNAPTSLDGTKITIGGQAAFIDYISPGQVNAQVPSSVGTGTQQVIVTTATGTSAPYPVTVNATQPGLLAPPSFNLSGIQYAVAFFADGTYVLPTGAISGLNSRPARPGDTVVLYGIGFGPVTPDIPAGQIVQETNTLASSFQVSIGGMRATVNYSGLAPDYVGLYQFNVVVPNVGTTGAAPLTFTLGGVSGTQTLYLAIQN